MTADWDQCWESSGWLMHNEAPCEMSSMQKLKRYAVLITFSSSYRILFFLKHTIKQEGVTAWFFLFYASHSYPSIPLLLNVLLVVLFLCFFALHSTILIDSHLGQTEWRLSSSECHSFCVEATVVYVVLLLRLAKNAKGVDAPIISMRLNTKSDSLQQSGFKPFDARKSYQCCAISN